MLRQQRNVAREQFWRRHISRQRHSGLTIRDYCQLHDLHENSFYSWRRTINERDRPVVSPIPPSAAPAFLPVAIVGTSASSHDSPIDIRLADGHRIRVRAGSDRKLLADVLALLQATAKTEARPC
jgi:transposase-like protein